MSDREHVVRRIADGFHFVEGPRWHDGKLYFSDFYGGKVFALDSNDQVTTVCEWPKWLSGLGFTPRGELLAVAVVERKLLRCSGDGQLSEVADLGGLTNQFCNDMLVDEQGRAYIGNFGFDTASEPISATNLFMVAPDGEVNVVANDLIFPNGMARTADGRTLIVAETFAGRLSAFDILENGRLSGHRTWASFTDRTFGTVEEALDSGVPLPDGIALDVEGNLWIGDAGGRAVLRVAPGGEILDRVSTPGLSVYAAAFGGPDRKTLYLCAAPPLNSHDPTVEKKSVLFATRVDVPGVPTS
jgi:sugar lactone lactonase YvrE